VENDALSVPLHYMHYNSCRIHKPLRVTPAMAAGVRDRLWDRLGQFPIHPIVAIY
jgi:hypothetical protein